MEYLEGFMFEDVSKIPLKDKYIFRKISMGCAPYSIEVGKQSESAVYKAYSMIQIMG